MDNKYLIVCLSNQYYDLPLKTNKHLVMDRLAKRGHKVIFVNPPTRFKALKNLLSFNLVRKERENLWVYTPVNLWNFFPFSWLSNLVHSFVLKKLISKISNNWELGIEDYKLLLWVYHFDFPRIWDIDNSLNPGVFIYDVVDEYSEFPEYKNRDIQNTGIVKYIQLVDRFFKENIDQGGRKGVDWVNFRENKLAKRADIMFSSHPYLKRKFEKLNSNIYYTPNAGDFELYSEKPDSKPKELKNLDGPIVGYSGAIDAYKFDVQTFIYTAKNTPDINYVMIGPVRLSDSSNEVEKIKELNNVHLVGVKSFEETARFTHYFDSYIIPYGKNEYTKGCFPVKFFNTLATGTPVVVTDLEAYKGFEDVLYIAKDKEEFLSMVKESVHNKDKSRKKERIKVASENTWEDKVNKQLDKINEFLTSN